MGWFSGDSTDVQLARIEAKLNAILDNLGIEFSDPTDPRSLSDRVRMLIETGQKIQAIKAHREETGASLRDAKQAVDGFRR